VFDSGGQAIGAFSIAGPSFRMTKEKIRDYGRKCAGTAAQLSALLK